MEADPDLRMETEVNVEAVTTACEIPTDLDRDVHTRDSVPDGGWGWVVVFATLTFNIIYDGCSYSFGILYTELLDYFGDTKSNTAWIGSLFFSVPLLCAPLASIITQSIGSRKATMLGGFIAAVGFFISAFSTSVWMLVIFYGLVGGFGMSLPYFNSLKTVTDYFDKRITLASGLAESGAGLGTVIFAPFTEFLVFNYGWRGTLIILSGIVANVIVCGALYRPITGKQTMKEAHDRTTSTTLKEGHDPSTSTTVKEEHDPTTSTTVKEAHDRTTSTTVKEEHDPTTSTTLKEAHDLTTSTTLKEAHDRTTPTTLKEAHDRTTPTTLKEVHDRTTPTTLKEAHDRTTPTTLKEAHDRTTSTTLKEAHDRTTSTTLKEAHDRTTSTTLKEAHDLTTSTTVKEERDPTTSATVKEERDPTTSTTLNEEHDPTTSTTVKEERDPTTSATVKEERDPTTSTTLNEEHDPTTSSTVKEERDLITSTTLNEEHEPTTFTTLKEEHDPTTSTTVKEERDLTIFTTVKEEQDLTTSTTITPQKRDDIWTKGGVYMYIEYLKNIPFLIFAFSNFVMYFWYDVPYVFMFDRSVDIGISDKKSSYFLSIIGFVHLFGIIGYGVIGHLDCTKREILYGISTALCGVAIALVPLLFNFIELAVFSVCFGLFSAASEALLSSVLIGIVGKKAFDTVYCGLILFIEGVANLIGPPVAGLLFDKTGNYDMTFYTAGGCLLFAGCSYVLLSCVVKNKTIDEPENENENEEGEV